MGMLEAHRRISRKAFFSLDRLGEVVKYNGEEIVALVYTGATLARPDWTDTATAIEHAAIADITTVCVCDEDVPDPQEGDSIVYKGETYVVAQIIKHDTAGCHWVLNCSANNKGYGR